jgi:hypothetical protein
MCPRPPPTSGRAKERRIMIDIILLLVLFLGLSFALSPHLHGWRRRRRAAWELIRGGPADRYAHDTMNCPFAARSYRCAANTQALTPSTTER